MSPISRASLLCAALAAVASAPALAADYDPPIYVEQAPEFVPVEIGSGWYLRGDISYNAGKPIYESDFLDIGHRRFGGGGGIGYHFTDNLRADVTINYLGRDKFAFDDGTDSISASYSAWSGLVSGYYDIATVVGITPYIGAGLGVNYSRSRYDIDAPSVPLLFGERNSTYDFAYALMAGASYKVADNISVDLGYQFLHAPDETYYDIDTLSVREGTKRHQIKLGLRYDLW